MTLGDKRLRTRMILLVGEGECQLRIDPRVGNEKADMSGERE